MRAPRGALATGPALAGQRPLRRRLTITSSHVVITEPVPDVLDELGWTGGECITDSRALIHYFRTTPDGRIAFGWGGGRLASAAPASNGRVELDRRVAAEVERQLVRFFPALQGRRVEHAWGGPIDVSPTHLPVVGSIEMGASTTPSATPAMGLRPRGSPAASSPRWPWTVATPSPACRSSSRRRYECPPSRFATSAG